jgi:hypothetical protein
MFSTKVLIVTIVLIFTGISLNGCKSDSSNVSISPDTLVSPDTFVSPHGERFANQLVTEESYRLVQEACTGQPVECERRPFELKTQEYCLKNKLDERDCLTLQIRVGFRLLYYTEKQGEETRQLLEKIQRHQQQK